MAVLTMAECGSKSESYPKEEATVEEKAEEPAAEDTVEEKPVEEAPRRLYRFLFQPARNHWFKILSLSLFIFY